MGQHGQHGRHERQFRIVPSFTQPATYLAAIVESSDDAIISKDLSGIITTWNRGATQIFGYTDEEAIGRPMTLLVPQDRLAEEDYILNTLRQGERLEHFESVRLAKDGHQVDISMTVSPIKNAAGKVIGISNIGRDISSRKNLERELQIQIENLAKTNIEIKDMTSIAAHDLKEPLRGLSMKSAILLEDYADKLDEDGRKKLRDLVNLSQRSHKLIDDLLSFSRIGKIAVVNETVDLNEIVHDVAQMMETRIKEKNAKIDVPQHLPTFSGDKKGLTEVVRNLITNAIIYNDKPEPVVEIGYAEHMEKTPFGPRRNVFYVRDNGIGIPQEFHEDIFRLFKRLPAAKDFNSGSTGLGLALVKKILDQCKGDIWLESEPGKGTTFYFTVGECVEMVMH